ncbi:hypothetical protein EMCRGX_G016218 [Ephydatia muelleri]
MADTDSSALHSLFPRIPIAVPMFVHFILVCLVLIDGAWLPAVYEFSHFCCFAVALWAIHTNERVQSLVMLIALLLFTTLTDIVVLALYFPGEETANGDGDNTVARTWQFSAAMCIVNLLLKPLSTVVIVYSIAMQEGFECLRFKNADNAMKNPSRQQNLEEGSVSGSQGFPSYQSE